MYFYGYALYVTSTFDGGPLEVRTAMWTAQSGSESGSGISCSTTRR
jgi:hypothetical protein